MREVWLMVIGFGVAFTITGWELMSIKGTLEEIHATLIDIRDALQPSDEDT